MPVSRLLLFILLLVAWVKGYPYDDPIDSLKSELVKHTKPDTLRVALLNQIGYNYWVVNPTQSIVYGSLAEVLAKNIGDSLGLAFSYRVTGVAFWAQASYVKAHYQLRKSLELYRNLNDTLGIANCLMNIGLIYYDQKDFRRTLNYYREALALFLNLGNEQRVAAVYNNLADLYIGQGEYELARGYLEQSLSIKYKNDYTYGIASAYNSLGTIFKNQNQFDSAIYYYNESIKLSISIDDGEGLARSYENIAHLYMNMGDNEKAVEFLEKGIIEARQTGSNKWLKEIFNDLRNIYQSQGDAEKALFYYDQYSRIRDSIYNEQIIRNLAEFEVQIATTEQQRLLQSQNQEIALLEERKKLDNVIKIAFAIGFVLLLLMAYLLIARIRSRAKIKEQKSIKDTEELKRELDFKNQELASYTVNFVQKSQVFEELLEAINDVPKNFNLQSITDFKKIISKHAQIDKEWDDFKLRFQHLHKDFFDRILKENSGLTNHELRLCALIKLNFSSREIANIMAISSDSVKTARYRLKKKLKIPTEESLDDFINQFD